jgi:effector protein SdcA
MPKLRFEEPNDCDYLYIDDSNRVHLLFPLVGGDEVAIDNTCKSVLEMKRFFFGHGGPSAIEQLRDYKQKLEADILAIHEQEELPPEAFVEILKAKKERLRQIKEYEVLVTELALDPKITKDLQQNFPVRPEGILPVLKSATNAFPIILSTSSEDSFGQFSPPQAAFSVTRAHTATRKYEHIGDMSTSGLGHYLRNAFLPTPDSTVEVNAKTPKEKVIDTVLAKLNTQNLPTNPTEFSRWKVLIEEELRKINPEASLAKSVTDQDLDLEYVQTIALADDTFSQEQWITSIIGCGVKEIFWQLGSNESPFYEKTGPIESDEAAEEMSIKVQFLLGEIACFCKSRNLTDRNMGEFLDQPVHSKALADLIKKGLKNGKSIESLVLNYVKVHQHDFNMKRQLTTSEEKEITEKFKRHYNTIKESEHFDEFFLLDPSLKGNIYSHRSRISCHFLEFYAQQAKKNLAVLEQRIGMDGYPANLQSQVTSNRLYHKNNIISAEHQQIQKFNQDVIKLVNQTPEKLVDFLGKRSPSGVPEFYKLEKNGLNTIVYSRHFTEFCRQIASSTQLNEQERKALVDILSVKSSLEVDNCAQTLWGNHAAEPLNVDHLTKIINDITQSIDSYHSKRDVSWWKGKPNAARERQIAELEEIRSELIETALDESNFDTERRVADLTKFIGILDKIDGEIAKEWNLFGSSLREEVRGFRAQLKEMFKADNFDFKPGNSTREKLIAELDEQIEDKSVRNILANLPSHCYTRDTMQLFAQLNEKEAVTVARYLQLGFHPFTAPVDKELLLTKIIPENFKHSNEQVLTMLKGTIPEDTFTTLNKETGNINPEFFTAENIRTWGVNIKVLENNSFKDLLIEISAINEIIEANKGDAYTPEQHSRMVELAQRLETTKRENFSELAQLPDATKETLNDFETRLREVNIEHKDARRKTQHFRDEIHGKTDLEKMITPQKKTV